MVHRQLKAHLRGSALPFPTKEGGGDSLIVTVAKVRHRKYVLMQSEWKVSGK